MTWRTKGATLLVAVPLAALIYWIADNTSWTDTQVPMPMKGEARTNPSYAAERFAAALGARTARDRVLTLPSPDSVVVLAAWNWNLSPERRQSLERWVERGGRLVVDTTLSGDQEFERWSGIVRDYRDLDEVDDSKTETDQPCGRFQEEHGGKAPAEGGVEHWICDVDTFSSLTTRTTPDWALREAESGIQAMRVRVGRGSVTVINAAPFEYRRLFDGDHGWLFAAATQLRQDDEVRFLSEGDYPSLLALIWQHGGPIVALGLALVALMLWRGGVRFGPLAAPYPAARRSLAEQIRGTGQFALHHGGGESLHAASVRALDEAARRRVTGYAHLSATERAAALSLVTGLEPTALAAAIYHPRMRRTQELRGTIAMLETARRRTLIKQTGSPHGTE